MKHLVECFIILKSHDLQLVKLRLDDRLFWLTLIFRRLLGINTEFTKKHVKLEILFILQVILTITLCYMQHQWTILGKKETSQMQSLSMIHFTILLRYCLLLLLFLHDEAHFCGYTEVSYRYEDNLLQHGVLAEFMRNLEWTHVLV